MGIKQIFINMGILGLFIFAIMSFVVQVQTDGSVTNPVTNNDLINETFVDLRGNLSGSEGSITPASDNFGTTTPTQEFGELEVTSIVAPTRIAKTIITGLWNVFIKLPQAVLGVSPVVASLISSILLVLLIIGTWAIWKGVVS